MIQGFLAMLSVNELALEIFDNLADLAEEFNCAYHELDNGARIVDCGVSTRGGYAAGRAFTEICMGGLGEVNFRMGEIKGIPMPFIDVNTDFPSIACLGAQKAGWTVKVGNYFAMGSGPARALSLKPKHTYEVIDYEDDYDCAVMCLESDHLPNGEVMEKIAEECHVDVANTCAVVAPTSSIVGSIQVSGRCVERNDHETFLAFLKALYRAHPRTELHVILDNVSTHKTPAVRAWLERHPRITFHFTPTSASWMNQVETWFGILSRQAIRRGSFGSVTELIAMIDAFTRQWNGGSSPFMWVKTADEILAKAVRKRPATNESRH